MECEKKKERHGIDEWDKREILHEETLHEETLHGKPYTHPVDDALGVQRGERGDDAGGAPARLLLAQPPLPVQPRQQLPACGTSML